MSPVARRPPKPKPVRPWERAEAGRHRSSDGRFTLESDGGGRWFVTDAEEQDELGLARTSGPFPTLAAAKAAADDARGRPAATSPLAGRLAEAATRPARKDRTTIGADAPGREASRDPDPATDRAPAPSSPEPAPPRPEPAPPPRTWMDDLAKRDAAAAARARALVRSLEREEVRDADALVRRDVLGDRAAIATRLAARDVLAAIARLENPSSADLAEAVAGVLASSPKRAGLPGWELLERGGPGGPGDRRRPIRLTREDLLAAAEDEATGGG